MSENQGADEQSPTTDPEEAAETEAEQVDADESEAADAFADLVARVEESDPEQLAREIESLRERAASIDDVQSEREDLEARLKRKQAEFQNYKKRMKKRREQEKQRATEDLVERLIDVRDNLARALEEAQETDAEGSDIVGGVESTLRQFDRILEDENVVEIRPEPGSEVDPQRHEVMLRVDSDQPADTIAEVYQSGYEMADRVLRPAQVTVSKD
ncbi:MULTISPECIES: nucleotide exchange factor GrpE [unclassified Haladaptatus]|uniref:nucleotide exchange factor GrpE n=1 Tax=unclassified Haladaptatus TaxID=2622732 RepID=UPI0023E7F4AE|nr:MULTISPECIES: nucleotide exchange factor GrpE [unclassified Haladaptatus]